eukprot:8269531-Lingulodinium_polyedra.AAC.1
MGFSWSLYFAQQANLSRLCRQPSLAQSTVMTDRGPPLLLRGDTESSGHFMYVDNAGVLSISAEQTARAISEAQKDFEQGNLIFHEVAVETGGGTSLGCCLDGHELATRPTEARFGLVRKGLRGLLRKRRVAGWELET